MFDDYLIECFSKELCRNVASRVIGALHANSEDMQSGCAALDSIWDEMCVQVQGGPFFSWEAYVDKARELTLSEVAKFTGHEHDSLWIVLREWLKVRGEKVEPDDATAAEYILSQYILVQAAKRRDPQVQAHLDRAR